MLRSLIAYGWIALVVAGLNSPAPAEETTLVYFQPATQWVEALPVGNGHLGAMVFGGSAKERIQFNENTVWTGEPHDYAHPGAYRHLEEIRSLLRAGKQGKATELAMQEFMSVPLTQKAYQAFGDLTIEHLGVDESKAQKYHRMLDLSEATSLTSYQIEDGSYIRRKVFASYPDDVLVVQIYNCKKVPVNVRLSMSSPHPGGRCSATGNELILNGNVEGGAIRFEARALVRAQGGTLTTEDSAVVVRDAGEVVILLAGATNYVNYHDVSADPAQRTQETLEKVANKPYADLLRDHLADHQKLFDRVHLDLGESKTKDLPTDERILKYAENHDPALATLLFNYGRYLLIASSRPGGQPANLQGLWNESLKPPWDSKYTVNINTEMNYWPAEPANLAECAEPLFGLIKDVSETGRNVAKEHYHARGWVLHHNTDLWRGTAPINHANHGIWVSGGAWLCQNLWWRYEYSGDEAFLRDTAYPIMKEAALFFVDTLVEDKQTGWLISGPSNSPEIGGLVMGPTMDHQIIRNLLANTIQAAEILSIDADLRAQLTALRSRIAPNQIGKHGQLQEWLEDKDDPNETHRHVSHLWGLFPGSEITPEQTPELFKAAKQSLLFRGDSGTGWSMGWKVNFWARLQDGDHAHLMLSNLLRLTGSSKTEYKDGGIYPNLFDAHPPFQIDGNFGATSGIIEMLLQSHQGYLHLLPALPSAWPKGSVTGLRARGGFEVGITWREGKLQCARFHSNLGKPLSVLYAGKRVVLALDKGKDLTLDGDLNVLNGCCP